METTNLGKTGQKINRCGFGGMSIGGSYGAVEFTDAVKLVHEAVELGVNFFDTADVYGDGRSEEVLGLALRGVRDRICLSTKGGIVREPGAAVQRREFNNSEQYLRSCVEKSLRRLQTDWIDLYYIHRRDPRVPIEDVMGSLGKLQTEGKIGAIGLCEINEAELSRACQAGAVAAVQSEYSLWERSVERSVLPACIDKGVTLVAYSPLGRGLLTGQMESTQTFANTDARSMFERFSAENIARQEQALTALRALAALWNCSLAQLSLAWVFSRHPSIAAIPGTKRVAYLKDNLAAASIRLAPEQIRQIEDLLPPDFISRDR